MDYPNIKFMNKDKLDLGCGFRKKTGFIGIDAFNWGYLYKPDEFICGSIPEALRKFKDNSIAEVVANHFIEHIPQAKVIKTFNEIYRILAVGGLFKIRVPPTTGRGAFCDPTHVSFWNDMSFRYFDKTQSSDSMKSYGIHCDFKIVENKVVDEFNLHVILEKR